MEKRLHQYPRILMIFTFFSRKGYQIHMFLEFRFCSVAEELNERHEGGTALMFCNRFVISAIIRNFAAF